MNMTVVVPIDLFPFFAHVVLKNINEMCFEINEVDFVFLTPKTPSVLLKDSFHQLKKIFNFRVVEAPFETNGDHLKLLTWFIKSQKTRDWIGVQHCDVVWTKPFDWSNGLNYNFFTFDRPNKDFIINEKPCIVMDDVFCIVNKKEFNEKKLEFSWGFAKNVYLSDCVWKANIKLRENCSRVIKYKNNKFGKHVWLDGSEPLTLEASVRFPEDVYISDAQNYFFHIQQFFRCFYKIKNDKNKIFFDQKICDFDKEKVKKFIAYYSYITNFLFEKEETYGREITWKTLQNSNLNFPLEEVAKSCEILHRYRIIKNPPKNNFKELNFKDFSIKNKIFI